MNIDKINEKKDNNEIILKLLRLIFLNISTIGLVDIIPLK